jgi:hypothetical protein
MHIIIGIFEHIIIAGIPIDIAAFMRSQQSFIMSMAMPSIGFMVQTMPSAVISQVMVHIIIGIGIGIPIMPFIIMGFIGIPIIGFIMLIIGFIMLIMLIMGFIGMFIIGFIMPLVGICIAGIIVLESFVLEKGRLFARP